MALKMNPKDRRRLQLLFRRMETIPRRSNRLLRHVGDNAIGRAKVNATKMGAVDTGNLRRGITGSMTKPGTYLMKSDAIDPTTGKNYAAEVHEGLGPGRNSVARPYLGNAYRWAVKEYRKRMRENLRKIGRR